MEYLTRPLESKFIKNQFDCGYALLDNYIKMQAKQDVNRDLSACFVLVDQQEVVKGYYTLSASSIKREDIPDELSKKLPQSYTHLPTVLLGRLAIDKSAQGNRYGEALLLDALKRCVEIAVNLGTLAVIVDPIDNKAQQFYLKYGFIILPGSEKMFLPMKTIKALFP